MIRKIVISMLCRLCTIFKMYVLNIVAGATPMMVLLLYMSADLSKWS